ncbi:hypothetical protein JKP88DRAFT_279864 [Tribonema minus]|uniref:ABM domain-containing protein n=1 Tax=Tribonema minus TaxID=303371 RepID=A0A835YS87_9STRA|nr:hypothetical protein JKP88DRAFT_279864 [Tribonema minus]
MSAVIDDNSSTAAASVYAFGASLNPITDSTGFRVAQKAYAAGFATLATSGLVAGQWIVDQGIWTESTQQLVAQAATTAGGVHLVMACAAAWVASTNGADVPAAFGAGLATGALELLRSLGYLSDEEKAEQQKNRNSDEERKLPPLQMEISSLSFASSPTGVMLSTSICAREGCELAMRTLLETLARETGSAQRDLVGTMAVNQDPGERRSFFMLQRFPSIQAMSRHQTSAPFKAFTDAAEALIEEPMGLYLVNERSGRMTEPVYPFGPGGEGGRDDAVFSSPVNLQGSQGRGMRPIKEHQH